MQKNAAIQPEKHGPLGEPMARAVQACVHCGFCLAVCPTYRELGQEMDSPRGRIVLMKQVLEGNLPWEAAQPHIDRCLGCLACEPACPSGVPYRDLLSSFRAVAGSRFTRTPGERLSRFMVSQTIPHPARFRAAATVGRAARVLRPFLPRSARAMLDLLPPVLPRAQHWPEVTPAQGERRARVALLTGCAQQVLDPDINTATIDVLARNGVEVVVPRSQGCCGGLAWHTGDLPAAQAFARRNLDAFSDGVDAIVTNAAGCGSAMHEYALVLRGTADEARAEAFCRRVTDASRFLARLGLRDLPPHSGRVQRIVYQDACHLLNAQGVGSELRELAEPFLCCGSAGTYNIDQPEIAGSLGGKKARAVIASGAECVASGNIGCLTQLRLHLAQLGSRVRARHTFQILRDACAERGA